MTHLDDGLYRIAFENATRSIELKRYFPDNVFLDGWNRFTFFHADWVFNREFVGKMQRVLNAEGGACACLVNLHELAAGTTKEPSMFIDKATTGEAYAVRLCGPTMPEGWVARMDRFSCASDTGQWCFYCEKDNELVVITTRENGPKIGFESVIQQFDAMPLGQAIEKPLTFGFWLNQQSPNEWHARLIKAYGCV